MYLKKLTSTDHGDVIKLFGDEEINYQFLIDGLIKNNYLGDFKVFGEYEDHQLVSVLVNNYNNITYFSKSDRDISIYHELLKDLNYSKLSGPSIFMQKFTPYVDAKENSLSYLGVVKSISSSRKQKEPIRIISTKDEIRMQYDLLGSTNEFKGSLPTNREEYVISEYERLKNTSDRTVYITLNDEMVASCSTIMEDKNSAIVIGVVTNPKVRNMGYGTEVLLGLFERLLEEGKYPYLFYNNPVARSVYQNIGMTEVCEWRVIKV